MRDHTKGRNCCVCLQCHTAAAHAGDSSDFGSSLYLESRGKQGKKAHCRPGRTHALHHEKKRFCSVREQTIPSWRLKGDRPWVPYRYYVRVSTPQVGYTCRTYVRSPIPKYQVPGKQYAVSHLHVYSCWCSNDTRIAFERNGAPVLG